MSSLLQHGGPISARGVGLIMYRVISGTSGFSDNSPTLCDGAEFETCQTCGESHEVLYIVTRRPVGMLGCWVQFRYNGAIHAPDLSIPIKVFTLPRGAVRMTPDAAAKYWHSS